MADANTELAQKIRYSLKNEEPFSHAHLVLKFHEFALPATDATVEIIETFSKENSNGKLSFSLEALAMNFPACLDNVQDDPDAKDAIINAIEKSIRHLAMDAHPFVHYYLMKGLVTLAPHMPDTIYDVCEMFLTHKKDKRTREIFIDEISEQYNEAGRVPLFEILPDMQRRLRDAIEQDPDLFWSTVIEFPPEFLSEEELFEKYDIPNPQKTPWSLACFLLKNPGYD